MKKWVLYSMVAVMGISLRPAIAQETPAAAPAPESYPVKSVLFSNDDMDKIRKSRASYERRIAGEVRGSGLEEEDFLRKLDELARSKAEPTSFTYPQFFLASILYHSSNDWVVWLNSQKITQDKMTHPVGLTVVHIDPQIITLRWKPERMDKVADIEPSIDNPVLVDRSGQSVEFTLRGNQTFSSYAMRVVEGKLQPVTVGTGKEDTSPGAPRAAPKAPSQPQHSGTAPKDRKTGIGGLIGAYEAIGDRDKLEGNR